MQRTTKRLSVGEERFAQHLRAHMMSGWEREYRFAPDRRWRFDFAHPGSRLSVEIEGGTWSGGRHTTGTGFAADCEKYNAATVMGWRVLRFTPDQVASGEAINTVRGMMEVAHG